MLLDPVAMGSPFDWVELAALGIMAFYFGMRFRRGRSSGLAFLREFALIAPAAWVAEDTCIHAYAFYAYDPRWHVFADRMPLLVAAIWPFVIISARELAQRLYPGRLSHRVLTGAAIVIFDATLMECVAVSSGLWRWFEPGPFGVPLMGIFGWGCFAAATILLLEVLPRRVHVLVVVLAPLLTHGLLLVTWWGFFRWVTAPIPSWPFAVAAILLSAVLTVQSLRWRRITTIPLDEMLARMVAASLFFALLLLYHRDDGALIAFALSFAPPYFALMTTERAAAPRRPTGCTPQAGARPTA